MLAYGHPRHPALDRSNHRPAGRRDLFGAWVAEAHFIFHDTIKLSWPRYHNHSAVLVCPAELTKGCIP